MTTSKLFSKFVVKVLLALVLTFAATVGSGVVAEQIGMASILAAFACTTSGDGE